jgi:hypothetical protein
MLSVALSGFVIVVRRCTLSGVMKRFRKLGCAAKAFSLDMDSMAARPYV